MPVSLPEGEVGVSVSFRTISLPFEAIRAEYLSRTHWLRKGRPSCPFCTRYKLAPWPKTYDRYTVHRKMFAINNFREFREWSTFANIIIRELYGAHTRYIYLCMHYIL